jgi:Lar family restriction alleviation protein
MTELKACPFCGSNRVSFYQDEEQHEELDTTTGFIWCRGCDFSSDSYLSYAIAVEKWNARAGWVSVSERLPEAGERVIGLFGGVPWEVYWTGKKWTRNEIDYEDWFDAKLTHWMPLPQPPEVQ